MLNKQVTKNHYLFGKYCDEERFASYWHQLKETLALNPTSVLEIGVGDKVFSNYLKSNTEVNYRCVDIAEDLNPDIVGSVTDLPIEPNGYDVVCAFEILEHLPFDQFGKALSELKRVSKEYIVLSLPHWGRHFSFKFRLPFFKQIKFQHKFNLSAPEHKFNGEHYWEIGKRGYSLKRIKQVIKKEGLEILSDYVVFESPYHHFFVLKNI